MHLTKLHAKFWKFFLRRMVAGTYLFEKIKFGKIKFELVISAMTVEIWIRI